MVTAFRASSTTPFSKRAPLPSLPSNTSAPPSDALSVLVEKAVSDSSVPRHNGTHRLNKHRSPSFREKPVEKPKTIAEAASPVFASHRSDLLAVVLWYRVEHPLLSTVLPHPRALLSRLQRLKMLVFVSVVQFDIVCIMFAIFSQGSVAQFRSIFAMVFSVVLGYPFFTLAQYLFPADDKVCSFSSSSFSLFKCCSSFFLLSLEFLLFPPSYRPRGFGVLCRPLSCAVLGARLQFRTSCYGRPFRGMGRIDHRFMGIFDDRAWCAFLAFPFPCSQVSGSIP